MPWPSVSFGSMRLWDTYTTWNDLNPSAGNFNWPALDRWLDAAQQHGVDVIYTFGATPTWASSNPTGKCDYNPGACYPPANMQDWDNFVRAVATHAVGRIKYWEMWNEANQHGYWSGSIPALVTMTQHASAIIKSVAPKAMIFTPSAVGGDVDTSTFLDKFFAAGGGAPVDAVAFHGYVNSIPAIPESVNQIVDAVQDVMAAHGQSGKPLWDTEGSWGPSDHLTGDDARMAFVARHYILQWSKGVQRFYWYAWNDKSYGTLFKSGTGTLEKAGMAYAQVERWLVGANLTAPCSASKESTWTCNLTLAGGAGGQIVWNAGVNIPATIPFTPASNFAQYTDLDGKITQLSGGPIQIGAKPILLTVGPAPHAPAKKSARNTETGQTNPSARRRAFEEPGNGESRAVCCLLRAAVLAQRSDLSADASKSRTHSFFSAAKRKSNRGARGATARLDSGVTDVNSFNGPLFSGSARIPLPQSSSSLPNPPTANSPADGATGVSTFPTLTVNVSDPNSSKLTVNFYGKAIPSVTPGPNFTIVALPDTQYYSSNLNGGTLAMFNSQTQWIVNNLVAKNIAFVIGLGDIVQDGNNGGNYSEWINANSAVSVLDDPTATGLPQGIPYSFGVGNHDQGPSGNGSPNDTAGYNQYFGVSRYSSKSYYGGHYGTQNDNHYELFSASGMDFIVINLAYDVSANPNVLAWANGLLQTYSSRRGIVVSHYLIDNGFNAAWSSQGQATYNALKGNPNLFLMLCGHVTPPEGQRADIFNGDRVYTLMSDYQEDGAGGDGWLRILTFSPASNQIQIQTYSPYINQFESTSAGNFTINYDMQGTGNNFTLLASNTGVLSGNPTSYAWSNLSPGSQYEWYVTVSNSSGTTVGPLWSFTTTGGSPVTLSPSSLSFPSQLVNTTSAVQTVTLTNTGTAALSVTSIVASGDFMQTNTCGTSVAAGANCAISVTFTPTATGTRTGAITITDNAAGSPQSVNLTGTGAAPGVSLSPSSLTFGNQNLNTTSVAQSVTLNNTGNVALSVTSIVASGDFMQTNTCGTSVAAGANCTISVTFTPTATGIRTGAVTITDNIAGSPQTISLTGTGAAPAPIVSLSATNLSFGNQLLNTTSAAQSVTLSNTGSAALNVTSIAASAQYAQTNTCGTSVAAGANCTTSVTFTPTATGAQSGTITITDNAAGSPHIVSMSGTGSATLTYSIRVTGKFTEADSTTTAVSSQTVTNTGFAIATGDLIVVIVRLSQPGESTSTCSDNVNPGNYTQAHYQEDTSNGRALMQYYKANSASSGSLTITCHYPVAANAYLGALDYSGAATSSPLDGHIGTTFTSATTTPTSGSITPTQSGDLFVGSVSMGVSTTTTVNTESTGFTTELKDTEGTANHAHAHTADEVLSGTSAQNYHPTFSSSITTMDILTAYKASGGGGASVSLSSTSLTFASQLVGTTSAAQTVTLNNTGNTALSVTSIVASGDYAQTNTCGNSVAAGANCTISVTFTPAASGAQSGTITITDNAAGSPHTVSLTGAGN